MSAKSIFSKYQTPAYTVFDGNVPEDDQETVDLSASLPLPDSEFLGQASIGEGVHMKGEIETEILIIHKKGSVKGIICAEHAEIHGEVDGEITISKHLEIRSTGLVAGIVIYGELFVEVGGRVTGQLGQFSEKIAERQIPTLLGEVKASINSN